MLASHNSAILESERLKKGKVDLCRDNSHVEELQKKTYLVLPRNVTVRLGMERKSLLYSRFYVGR